MKPLSLILASLLLANVVQAQAPATGEKLPDVKVRIKNVQVEEQQTPQLSVSNVKMKRWTPKNWIEFDVEFDIKLPVEAGGRKGSYPGMQLNIYAALQEMTKDAKPKRIVLQGTLDLLDIPADEPCHALGYISPAAMKSLTMKDTVTASVDIQGWGVEIVVDGKVIAAKSSVGKNAWWENKDNFAIMQGMVLNKMQTPFAAVFGDYDVPVKVK
ncbi:MAG: Amuc_1102 family pilus-like protein [Prosthecobacter sp.]|uniref:Amuc_1102 family pilus-like protein n=1 Tax=Prosthecobacter sp. TaxID=1965333 RepID=UPI003BB17489